MSDPESFRVLRAARELVALGLLAREPDARLMDVCVAGQGFRYRVDFWKLTGVLEGSEVGWHLRFDGTEDAARARLRVAREWTRAGAPVDWACAEADSALELFLSDTVGTAWGTA